MSQITRALLSLYFGTQVELFRELQLLSTDYLRQRALYSLQDLVTTFISEEGVAQGTKVIVRSYGNLLPHFIVTGHYRNDLMPVRSLCSFVWLLIREDSKQLLQTTMWALSLAEC